MSPLFNLRKFQKIGKSTGESIGTQWGPMNQEEFESFKFLELKYRKVDQVIQPFCRIRSFQEIRSPLFHLEKFQKSQKCTGESCTPHLNIMNDKEFKWFTFLKLKYRREDQIIQPFCKIGSHQEIMSPLLNLRKFQKIKKSTGESIGTYWSSMNDKEFESLKFMELK